MKTIEVENIMKVIDIDSKQLMPETVKFIEENVETTYRDQVCKEHLYNINSFLDEFDEDSAQPSEAVMEELKLINKILVDNEAGYLRITN